MTQLKPPIEKAEDVAASGDREASADEYARGLPKRGARKVAIMVLGGAAVLALFFTTDNKPLKPPVEGAVTRPENTNLTNQLKAEAKNQPLPERKPEPPPPAPPIAADNTAAQLSPEEIARLKREKAAASPMDANDVVINIVNMHPVPSAPSVIPNDADLFDKMNRNTNTLVDKVLASQKGGDSGRRTGTDEAFLASHKDPSFDDLTVVQRQRSDPAIAPGTIIRLVLMRGINTDSPGQITAQVVSNVYDSRTGRRLMIPKGSRVIGVYSSDFVVGQRRVVMAMTRLDLPNGDRISLAGGPAADPEGYSGLPGAIDNHYMSMFGASLMVGFASMLLPKDQQMTTSTMTQNGTQSSGTVLGSALNSTVNTLAERNKIMKPTATIEPGTQFSFSTTKEVLMREYIE